MLKSVEQILKKKKKKIENKEKKFKKPMHAGWFKKRWKIWIQLRINILTLPKIQIAYLVIHHVS